MISVKNYLGLIKVKDNGLLFLLSIILMLPLVLDFLAVWRGQNSNTTLAIYLVTFAVSFLFFWKKIRMKNFLLLLFFYLIVLINVVFFPVSVDYIKEPSILFILAFYFPIGALLIKEIKDWSRLFQIMTPFSILSLLIGVYLLFFVGVSEFGENARVTYMEFSYALMPFVCSLYARFHQERSFLFLICTIFGIAELLVYGCRGALLYSLVFMAFVELLSEFRRNKIRALIIGVIVFVLISIIPQILFSLTNFQIFSDSYILQHFINGDVFEHSTRTTIYSNCQTRLSNMGLEVSGLFGDRAFCGSVYPHNFFYEIYMQHGWILGTIILLFFFIKIVKFSKVENILPVSLFLICSLFLRFLTSGSYLESGIFWIMFFSFLSLSPNTVYEHTTNIKHIS